MSADTVAIVVGLARDCIAHLLDRSSKFETIAVAHRRLTHSLGLSASGGYGEGLRCAADSCS